MAKMKKKEKKSMFLHYRQIVIVLESGSNYVSVLVFFDDVDIALVVDAVVGKKQRSYVLAVVVVVV